MSINIKEYLNLAKETAGLYPWQEFFIADKKFSIEQEQEENFKEDLELLFPETDISLNFSLK
ncbi:hypothetical protein QUF90_05910 [Desulfococcaceae bacterium HSG9]|nr:hypothetical protein [Desulfococcaceae bacterium HSG9]